MSVNNKPKYSPVHHIKRSDKYTFIRVTADNSISEQAMLHVMMGMYVVSK